MWNVFWRVFQLVSAIFRIDAILRYTFIKLVHSAIFSTNRICKICQSNATIRNFKKILYNLKICVYLYISHL